MKTILLLFLIISCGHETPEAIDLQDDDGDLIANAYESDRDRFVAQFKTVAPVNGMLEVRSQSGRLEAPFTNYQIPEDYLRGVLTGSRDKRRVPVFREFGLDFKRVSTAGIGDDEYVELTFHFPLGSPRFHSFSIWHKGQSHRLGAIDSGASFRMKGSEVKSFLADTSWIEFHRDAEEEALKERIASRTRRVFVRKDGRDEFFYVSSLMPIEAFARAQGLEGKITNALSNEMVFMNSAEKRWWYHDKDRTEDAALLYSTVKDIRNDILEERSWSGGDVARREGTPEKSLTVDLRSMKGQQKKLYITLSLNSYVARELREGTDSHGWDSNRGENYNVCQFQKRWVAREFARELDVEWIKKSLLVSVDGSPIDFKNSIEYEMEERADGVTYLNLAITVEGDSITFSLPRSEAGVGTVGIYNSKCPQKHLRDSLTQISMEKEMNLRFTVALLEW